MSDYSRSNSEKLRETVFNLSDALRAKNVDPTEWVDREKAVANLLTEDELTNAVCLLSRALAFGWSNRG